MIFKVFYKSLKNMLKYSLMNKKLIESIDHLVITVKNINNCKNFYCNFLGMELVEFTDENETRYSFKFGRQKINVHFFEKPYSPHALNVIPGSQDICFITKMDIQMWAKRCEDFNIEIELGPIKRSGAIFEMNSIYLRDPDSNLIEIAKQIE